MPNYVTLEQLEQVGTIIGERIAASRDSSDGSSVHALIQLRNTDTTTQLNNSSWTTVPIGGIVDIHDAAAFDIVNTHSVRCKFDGRVKCHVNLSQTTSNVRTQTSVRLTKNGNQFSGVGMSSYIRSASGHNESSSDATGYVDVLVNDVISVQSTQQANNGVIVQVAGASLFSVERVL